MGCDCGKPKCDGHCGISPAVLQINNPSECVLFHRVEVPASMGDSKTNPPKSGAYKNVLLYYEADQTSWLYSSDGVPQKLVNGLTDYEAAINLPQINGVTLLGNKSLGDLGITGAIDDAVAEEKAEREAADEALGDEIDAINDELLSRAVVFDTVADMKAATNLVNGSYARTLGFYSVNDGGGALYKITSTGTANEMDVIAVGSLFANLIHTDSVYIKQLGAYGDNINDDTLVFDQALSIVDHVIVNKSASPYLVKYVKLNEGKSLEGEALPYVQINLSRSGSAVIPRFYSNTSMDKIYLNSVDANLSNNRLDLRDSNIRITNSRIEGFRADNRNAWGILLTGAKNVVIDNCYFKNNTQSDIALVEGCENVTISNCNGDSFHINVEPQHQPIMYNIVFEQCNLAELDLRENQNVYDNEVSFTVRNCTIDLLEYDGANVTFIDCVIKDIQQQGGAGNNGAGGQAKFINSLNMGKNLIDDVYLDSFEPSTSGTNEWCLHYTPIGINSSISMAYKDNVPVLTIHPYMANKQTITIKHQPITVSNAKIYMLRLSAGADYTPAGTVNISKNVQILCYDTNDVLLDTIEPSMFRGESGSVVPMHEEVYFFKVSENATSITLRIRNANYGQQSFSIRSCELFEIGSSLLNKCEVASPAVRHRRIYSGNATYTNINNVAGDLMLYKTPTAGGSIGQVCTTGGYPATWKDFGTISS